MLASNFSGDHDASAIWALELPFIPLEDTVLAHHDEKFLFTSESVTEGHPDKIADQISDAVLDAVLKDDPMGRVACETLVTTGLVVVAGEITITTYVDFYDIAREVIRDVGYTRAKYRLRRRYLRRHLRHQASNRPTSPWALIPAAPATRA